MSETPTTPGTLFRSKWHPGEIFLILDKDKVKNALEDIESGGEFAVLTLKLGSHLTSDVIHWWGSIYGTTKISPEDASAFLEKHT